MAKPAVETLENRSLLDASAFVRGLYANILDRPSPSAAEVNGWVNLIQNGMSLQTVSSDFIYSSEHMSLIVKSDYSTFLGRTADQPGLNYWVQQLSIGVSQDQVAASFLGSEEFLMKHGSTNYDFINGAYETVLGRDVDNAGFAYWNEQLSVETDRQTSHQDVGSEILASNEAHVREVDQIYSELLHRSPGTSESAYWANILDEGATQSGVVGAIANSPEYLGDYGVAEASS